MQLPDVDVSCRYCIVRGCSSDVDVSVSVGIVLQEDDVSDVDVDVV
ncbi:hypothetical protein Hamer_G016348 [Homarus americanus]|uniref:Uncharacterized protein n=1 Tax=Homarus americanus TaxID=6706 RepID=A0A8J5JMX1_HOMAM|nr:hypothetical protein Hamer_G016348 [Homarus americanus]